MNNTVYCINKLTHKKWRDSSLPRFNATNISSVLVHHFHQLKALVIALTLIAFQKLIYHLQHVRLDVDQLLHFFRRQAVAQF